MALSIVRRHRGCRAMALKTCVKKTVPNRREHYTHINQGIIKAGALQCTPTVGWTERDSNKH